MTMYRTIFDWT